MRFILDFGHGIDTSGKRSPKWDNGAQLFEYEFNRSIGKRVALLCDEHNIDYNILVPEIEDIRLSERVKRANEIYMKHKDAILISIHANGFSDESANGFEVFTSKGRTKSDSYAKIIHIEYLNKITTIRDRGIKEANFYIIKRTKCPAVLIECGFMTNFKECMFLINNKCEISQAIFNGIKKIHDVY